MIALIAPKLIHFCAKVTVQCISNFLGIRDFPTYFFHTKRRKIFNYAKKHISRKWVIFLQETHSVQKDEQVWTNQFGCGTGSVFFSHGKSDARGVLIAFQEGIKYKVIEKYIDTEGRILCLICC